MLGRVLKVLLALAGVVFTLVLLALGVLVALGVIVFSLLRGRKPVLRWQTMSPGAMWPPTAGARSARTSSPASHDVVDVEVREVAPSRAAIPLD